MGAVLIVAAGHAMAQVATPPPAYVPRPEVVIPPPPPPPPPIKKAPNPNMPEAIQVPNIPYVPILKKDAEGKVVRLEGHLDLLALKHNPTVGPGTVDRIRPKVEEWVGKIDALVRDNLDLVMDVDSGVFQRMDFANEQEVMLANEIMKALITVGGLNNYLLRNEAWPRVQFDFNARITQEYKQALNLEILEGIRKRIIEEEGKENRAKFFQEGAKHTFRSLCEDAIWSYHRQLREAAGVLDQVLPRLELTGDAAAAAADAAAQVKAAESDADRLEAMRALMGTLEFEQQQRLLTLTAELHSPPKLPELDEAVTKPDGAEPREPDAEGNVQADPE